MRETKDITLRYYMTPGGQTIELIGTTGRPEIEHHLWEVKDTTLRHHITSGRQTIQQLGNTSPLAGQEHFDTLHLSEAEDRTLRQHHLWEANYRIMRYHINFGRPTINIAVPHRQI